MSIIVKGMEMPKNCRECPMVHREFDGYETRLDCYMIQDWCPEDEGVHPDCPLIALPDHHGRLMDADAFKADYGMKDDCADCEKEMRGKVMACEFDRNYSKMDFCGWLDDAPTIVEAEGENADHN